MRCSYTIVNPAAEARRVPAAGGCSHRGCRLTGLIAMAEDRPASAPMDQLQIGHVWHHLFGLVPA